MIGSNPIVQAGSAQWRRWQILVLACVIALALALRLNGGLTRDLWEDEVIAAAHAEQPFWRLPVAVMRFDVHPFLYFMFGDEVYVPQQSKRVARDRRASTPGLAGHL